MLRDVIAHGALAEEQRLGDLPVGLAFRDQQEDMFFLLAQVGEGGRFLLLDRPAHLLEDALGDSRVQQGLPRAPPLRAPGSESSPSICLRMYPEAPARMAEKSISSSA